MAEPTEVYDLAEALLATIVDAFATDGIALPERQFVTVGTPVADCEQVAVSYERLYIGVPGAAESPVVVTRSITRCVVLSAWVFRCVSVAFEGSPNMTEAAPKAEDLTADAAMLMTDALVLHRGITRAHLSGAFTGWCSVLSMGPAEPSIEGGIAATHLTLTFGLGGMGPGS